MGDLDLDLVGDLLGDLERPLRTKDSMAFILASAALALSSKSFNLSSIVRLSSSSVTSSTTLVPPAMVTLTVPPRASASKSVLGTSGRALSGFADFLPVIASATQQNMNKLF